MYAVELDSVAVRYSNGALGISDISFQVSEGQIVALFGPNGAGKTTSVRALSGFMKPERVSVFRGSVHRTQSFRHPECPSYSSTR